MKITSKAVYRELRTALDPAMAKAGYANLKSAPAGWSRSTPAGQLMLWFQCDKWGWDDVWGSTFTLEFQHAPTLGDFLTAKGKRERIGHLLEGFPELDELRVLNNSVIERLPGTIKNMTTFPEGPKVDLEKAIYGRDIWFHYYRIEDLRSWAAYFEGRLAQFASLFESGTRSKEGAANVRFNEMMGRVQASRLLEEKETIFKAYIGIEADEHYRNAAMKWLSDLREIRASAAQPGAPADGLASLGRR